MNTTTLSPDLSVITAEINSYKQIAGQSMFEIGKRLKYVKENDLTHGQWYEWVSGLEITPQTATRMIQAYDQFGNRTTSYDLPVSKIFEMLSLPESVDREEFIHQSHEIPSTGESKTVDEMTTRELREVKKKLQQAERDNQQLEAKYSLAVNQHTEQQEKLLSQLEELRKSKTKDSPETLKRIALLEQDLSKIAKLSGENLELKQSLEKQREEFKAKITTHDEAKHDLRKMKEAFRDLSLAVNLEGAKAVFHFGGVSGLKEAQDSATQSLFHLRQQLSDIFKKWSELLQIDVEEVGYEQGSGTHESRTIIDVSPGATDADR